MDQLASKWDGDETVLDFKRTLGSFLRLCSSGDDIDSRVPGVRRHSRYPVAAGSTRAPYPDWKSGFVSRGRLSGAQLVIVVRLDNLASWPPLLFPTGTPLMHPALGFAETVSWGGREWLVPQARPRLAGSNGLRCVSWADARGISAPWRCTSSADKRSRGRKSQGTSPRRHCLRRWPLRREQVGRLRGF